MTEPRFRSRAAAAATLAVALLGGSAGCDPDTTVELRLAPTPPNTRCVFFTAGTDRTTRVDGVFDANGAATATLTGVTAGVGYFSAEAFPVPCAMVGATTRVAHSGGPTRAVIVEDTNNVVTIPMVTAEFMTFSTRFPDRSLMCAPTGEACKSSGDCCSRNCRESSPGQVATCQATEPPGSDRPLDTSNHAVITNPDVRAGVSFPSFDGDWVFVSYPRKGPRLIGPPMAAQTVFSRFVSPALFATGQRVAASHIAASRGDNVLQELPGPSFEGVVRAACRHQGDLVVPPEFANATGITRGGDELSREVCSLLEARMSVGTPTERYLTAALGVTIPELEAEVNRSLAFWMFPQRVREIPLEHKGIIALSHDKGTTVSSVFGAALSAFQIVNDVGLGPLVAIARGREDLIKQLGLLPGDVRANREREAQVVLLPYGTGASSDGATALRFAFRATVAAGRTLPGDRTDVVAFTIWVDAQDGRLLKYAREGGDGLFDPFPWCRDPSTNGGFSERCMMPFDVVDPDEEQVTLSNGSVNVTVLGTGATQADINFMFDPLPCETHDFRAAHLRGHLDRVLGLTQHGGVLAPFGPLSLVIDANGFDNTANFDTRTITLMKGPNPGASCNAAMGLPRSGSEDGTIVAHEIGHLVTAQLQMANRCLADDCPFLNPNNRTFFHDYADGLAAMWTQTPCIGGWSRTRGTGTRDDLANACTGGNEASGLPRMLYADDRGHVEGMALGQVVKIPRVGPSFVPAEPDPEKDSSLRLDRLPEHRRVGGGGIGEYADGQIVGAAFWHLWQGMYSLVNDAANPVLWGRINRGIWSTGFAPTGCLAEPDCDLNIYRAGRELLLHLGEEWKETDAGQSSMNKLLAGFARAGIFAVPPMCVDTGPTNPDDPILCVNGQNAGDAIVVVDDRVENDGRNEIGIRLGDDDFIAAASTQGPTFRIWTGPTFEFNASGVAVDTLPGAGRCNRYYNVFYRLAGHPSTEHSTDWTPMPADSCYAEWTMPAPDFTALKQEAADLGIPASRIDVEYWVETSFDPPGDGNWSCELFATTGMEPTRRSSLCPGGGVWSLPSGFKPALFFINPSGLPP